MLVPSNDSRLSLNSTAAGSPFVIAIVNAGIHGLPSVINAAFLTSAWSAASSDLYISSRALYGLSLSRNAPAIFRKTTARGLPLAAILTCSAFSLLAYMGSSSGAGKVFGWFVNMTSISGLITWFGICVTYLRFRKGFVAQGLDSQILPYRNRLQPYAAWYGAIACPVACLFSGWAVFLKGGWDTAIFVRLPSPSSFSFLTRRTPLPPLAQVTNYLPLMLFPVFYLISLVETHPAPRRDGLCVGHRGDRGRYI